MEHPTKTNGEPLKKYRSLYSLQDEARGKVYSRYRRTSSDSSLDWCLGPSDEEAPLGDSGIGDQGGSVDGDTLLRLERKIDRLNDMFLEQCNLLSTLKEELRNSKAIMEKTKTAHSQFLVDMLKNAISQRINTAETGSSVSQSNRSDPCSVNSRAKCLLDAIEARQGLSVDPEVMETLVGILQSDELKEQMVRATAASVKGLVGDCFSRDMASIYLPVLEHSHRRLVNHVHTIIEQAFHELEDKSSSLFKSVNKTSGALRTELERHQGLLEAAADPGKNLVNTLQCTIEEFLHKELAEWRQKVLDMFCAPQLVERTAVVEAPAPPELAPVTPPQPANPQVSIIDQMMTTALINKQIQDGDVNGSFERALSAADLSLVMAACRRAEPAARAVARLRTPVLLSLAQQLATDMLHETNLKCSYLEEAILCLGACAHAESRAHLPLVVREVRAHLRRFAAAYPNHAAARRVTLIVMAAEHLLK